jgi:hypothetical protein
VPSLVFCKPVLLVTACIRLPKVTMPFLEVLTRCYKRPEMLAINKASIKGQTDADIKHTFLVDRTGKGIGAAQVRLADYAPYVVGDYVWILDDDDACDYPRLVEALKQVVADHNPDIIMTLMDHGPRGILPQKIRDFREGDLGVSAYIVRRELWQQCADAFRSARYASDWDFFGALMATGPRIAWLPVVASRVQRIGFGNPE